MRRAALIFSIGLFVGGIAAAEGLNVDLQIGVDIRDRQPVGVAEVFPVQTDQLAAWMRIRGATEPIEIQCVWIYQGRTDKTVELAVRSSSYRVWSFVKVRERKGPWTIEIRDMDDRVIATKTIRVE